jgi:hypothetical protein
VKVRFKINKDYIKWKPLLFYRYLINIVNEEMEVSNLFKSSLIKLSKKNNNLIFNHFIDTLYYFSNEEKMSSKKKLEIFCFLLSLMNINQKLIIHGKIFTDVLSEMTNDKNKLLNEKIITLILLIISTKVNKMIDSYSRK